LLLAPNISLPYVDVEIESCLRCLRIVHKNSSCLEQTHIDWWNDECRLFMHQSYAGRFKKIEQYEYCD